MRGNASLVTLNHKILRPCRKLLIRITKSCPRRHNRHLKLKKPSSSTTTNSGNKVTKAVDLFFRTFHKKKQKKEKMKRLNELRSFSHAVSDQQKKTSNQEESFPVKTHNVLARSRGRVTTRKKSRKIMIHVETAQAHSFLDFSNLFNSNRLCVGH
ncbi:unnamed protein product [Brassica rapa subsp. trilocularis]